MGDKSIKDEDTYEALRDEGYSKSKSAAIANAQANNSVDHDSTPLEDRTMEDLYEQAQELEIEGRSDMTKDELIEAIRDKN
ncbi:MAG: Rho termination factor [Sphingomonas sp.]|nr:Rho termination factor [Sphingomonas sp.]RZV49672.1 MAG: Rho termination factor [Sphingomonadaceae bacterium]